MKRIERILTDVKEGVISFELTPDSDTDITLDDIVRKLHEEGYDVSSEEIEVSYKREDGKNIITIYKHVEKDVDFVVEETFFGKVDKKLLINTNGNARQLLSAMGYEGDFRLEGVSNESGSIDFYAIYLMQKTPLKEDAEFSYDQAVPEKQVTIKSALSKQERMAILSKDIAEIRELRKELESIEDSVLRKEKIELLSAKISTFENKIASFESIIPQSTIKTEEEDKAKEAAALLRTEISELDEKIKTMEDSLEKKLEQYNHSIASQAVTSSLPASEEEALETEQEQLGEISAKNKESAVLEREVKASATKIASMKQERKAKESDLKKAEALNLTIEEYLEISNAIGRKKVEEAIMSQKGLADIYHKPYKERTKEEQEEIQRVKNEILKEIHEQKQANNISAFDAIQMLYHLELEFSSGDNPRVISVSQKDIDSLHQTAAQVSSKVVKKEVATDYTPGKAPEDSLISSEQAAEKQLSSMELLIAERVESLFQEDPWVKDHLHDQEGLQQELTAKEEEYRHMKAESERTPLAVLPSDLDKIQNEIEKINSELKKLDKEFDKKRVEIKSSLESAIAEKINSLYAEDSKVQDYLQQQEELQQELTAKEEEYRHMKAESERTPLAVLPSDLDKIEKEIEKIKAEIEKIKIELEKRREAIKLTAVEKLGQETLASTSIQETITLFRDEGGKTYTREHWIEKFEITPTGNAIRVNGVICYPISEEDASKIIDNQNTNDSSYKVVIKKIRKIENKLEATSSNEDKLDSATYIKNLLNYVSENNISIYKYYVELAKHYREDPDFVPEEFERRNPFLTEEHYKALREGTEERLPQYFAVLMRDEIEKRLSVNQAGEVKADEPIEPDINLGTKKDTPPVEPPTSDATVDQEKGDDGVDIDKPTDDSNDGDNDGSDDDGKDDDDKDKEKVDKVILLRVTNDNNKIYAPKETLAKFHLEPFGEPTTIAGLECYFVNESTEKYMQKIAELSSNPKLYLQYIDVEKEKTEELPKGKIHYQTVIQKLTEGLDNLSTKGARRFNESRIMVADNFALDIHSGNVLYNVIGFAPAALKTPLMKLVQLRGKISMLIDPETRADYEELERRLNELSDEELDVIFKDYRGSHAKADMNPQINSLIAARMRRYVKEKVANINDYIKINYVKLINTLKEIDAIDEKMTTELSAEEKEELEATRNELMILAAVNAQIIDKYRTAGIDLLSGGGLHGFEEDMKAVDSKMSYVGYRFAKSKEFDHETQKLLAEFGQGFNDAIARGDAEAVVSNFLGYEACYSDNTEIRNSIFGKRSVGTKYYTPLVEEFDYRDDPFIRNLLSTIAITSATISAANAIRVHKLEADKILAENKRKVHKVNAANENMEQQVHQVGRNIEGHRQTMMEGMKSQVMHDVNELAGDKEREGLDVNVWNINTPNYTSTDTATHAFYNNFYETVSGRLNNVASNYATGSINEMQALREIAQIANDSQSTLNQVITDYLPIIREYARNHPQFDIEAFEESMSYIVSHQDAVIDMNNGIVDIMDQASTLSGLSVEYMTPLSEIASDLPTTIASAASAVALAAGVAKDMHSRYGRKGQYGDEVTDMMNEYLNGEDEVEVTTSHRR